MAALNIWRMVELGGGCVRVASSLRQICVNFASILRQICVKIASILRQFCVKIAPQPVFDTISTQNRREIGPNSAQMSGQF